MSPLRLARQHTALPACHANRMVGKCGALDLNPSAQGNVGFTERWPLTVGHNRAPVDGRSEAAQLRNLARLLGRRRDRLRAMP